MERDPTDVVAAELDPVGVLRGMEPGRLDDAVEGHEVGHDQPSHVASL